MVNSEKSTAIDRVAATPSKSDEFSEFAILVIEIVSLLCLKPPKWCCTFWELESGLGHGHDAGWVVAHAYVSVSHRRAGFVSGLGLVWS